MTSDLKPPVPQPRPAGSPFPRPQIDVTEKGTDYPRKETRNG